MDKLLKNAERNEFGTLFPDFSRDNVKRIRPSKHINMHSYNDVTLLYIDVKDGAYEMGIKDRRKTGQGFTVTNIYGNPIEHFNSKETAIEYAKRVMTVISRASYKGLNAVA